MGNEYNNIMRDSQYAVSGNYFNSADGSKRYVPKKWDDNELIERIEMNNLEQGIQIALEQSETIRQTSQTAIDNMTNYYVNTILPSLNSFNERVNGLSDEISGYVSENLVENNTDIINTLQTIIGTSYDIQTIKNYSRPEGINAIDTRLTQLYNEVFGSEGSSSSSTSLNARVNELINTIIPNQQQNIYDVIGARLGSSYYSNNNWTIDYTDIDSRLNTLVDNITEVYNSVFGQNGSDSSEKTIIEQLESLNIAIFGSSEGGDSNGSLINKIEKAIGRTLELEEEETTDETGAYSNSLTAQINQIKGALGMDGGTTGETSNLVHDVEMSLNLLYGYTFKEEHENPEDETSPIIRTLIRNNEPNLNNLDIKNSYVALYNEFYNTSLTYTDVESSDPRATKTTSEGIIAILNSLGSDFGKVASYAKEANSTINEYKDILPNIDKAYSKAFPTVIGEDTYLVLSPIDQEAQEEEPATTLDQITEKKSTYVKLPKGGGGGGIGSNYFSRIENITRPQNRNISIGDNYEYSFYWMAYQLVDTESQQEEIFGEMRVSIDGTVVLTRTVDSGKKTLINDEYEYDPSGLIKINLGQYIRSTGRKNISIVISAEGYSDSVLSGYVIAYAPTLTIDLNTETVFSGNTINFPYLAAVGSNDVEKILYIEIDEQLVSNNNTTYLESSYSNASIETPLEDGGHLLTVYFKYRLDENSPLLESQKYNYGIITNRGSSNLPYIITDLKSNIELNQYDQLSVNYMVYGALSDVHTVTISIFDDRNILIAQPTILEAINNTLPQTPWIYSFDVSGNFILQFEVDNNENTKKSYNISVIFNQQYQFILQRPQNLILNLTPNGRSNQEPNDIKTIWKNSPPEVENREETIYDNITIEMNNFLFSDRNQYDGWLKDENNKSILRLRNTDEIIINNCPLLRQANINTGLTFEIEFKTSNVVNLNTKFFEQADAGLNIEQQQTNVTNKWNTELQYREEIEELYSSLLAELIEENNSKPEEEQLTEEKLKEQALNNATIQIVGDKNRPYEGWTEKDYETELERVTTEQSIVLTPQNFNGNARAQTILQYKEEELTTISYVFNPDNSGDDSLLIYCYINGILSNIKRYDQALNQSLNSFIRIGSLECTTDIYAIRLYNVALNSREVVQNWIYGLSNSTEKINAYERNRYGDSVISPEIFATYSKKTPYMIIRASGPLESPEAMPQAKGSDFATTVELRYVDPVNPENSFTSSETSIQVQGTSSQYYPRKNYKLKMKNFTQNNILHKSKIKSTDIDVSGEGYKLFENSVPVFNFCIKADYASSEGVNNTGLARIYDDVIRSFYKTPAQRLDEENSIRQAVDGKPMVVFYEEGYVNSETGQMEYKTPYFLGKYNFNNDKGTHEVFGLKTFQENWYYAEEDADKKNPLLSSDTYIGDESWEGADNFYPLDIFMPLSIDGERGYTKVNDLTSKDWKATFPARFPGVWEDFPEIADHNNWYEAIKWVYNTRTIVWKQDPVTKLYYDAALDENEPDYYVGPQDGKTREEVIQEHLEDFKNNFSNYFNLDAMLFFYCFTEFFLMVDNRAKNMFWTRYLTTANRNKDEVLAAGENQTYDKYISLPYDFDTAMGIDNQGMFQFNYNLESKDAFMPDGSLIFNGHPSIFWMNFIQVFEEEIGNTFRRLLDNSFENPLYPGDSKKNFRFDYNTIETRLEEHQSAWSETIFNEDAIFKYIKAHANYFMAQGSKREQRQWWLYNRFRYFKSKYRAGGISSTDNINIRANASGTITVSTIADCYVTFQLGSDSGVIDSLDTKRVLTSGGEIVLTLPNITANNSVINIYPASAIRSISGLSSLLLQTVNFNAAKKIQYLTIGSNTNINTTLTEVNISENPLLRHLDARNCKGFNTPLKLQICSSLETLYLAGTSITSVTLPDGGILKTVQYPTTIANITISNQPYLQNIIVGNYLPNDEIEAGREGSPIPAQIDSENYDNILTVFFDSISDTEDVTDIIINSSNLNNCTLKNLTFTMSGEQFEQLFEKLIFIKNINNEEQSIFGQVNVSNCVLYLTNNLPDNLTVSDITSEFDFKIYDYEGNEYYNVSFYDFSEKPKLIAVRSVVSGQSVVGPKEYFTEDYINNLNNITEENISERPTRQNFDHWDKSDENATTPEEKNTILNVTSDMDVYPVLGTQYRMDYELQTSEEGEIETIYRYYFPGEEINGIETPTFERNYYLYTVTGWQDETGNSVINAIKQPKVEKWIAIYSTGPQTYYIYLYNTDINGQKDSIALNAGNPIEKTVLESRLGNTITYNELLSYIPNDSNKIAMIGSGEENIPIENRKYQFLNWKPYVGEQNSLAVTGNMEIYLTYYNVDDIFTNYFLNKLTICDLGENITKLPKGSFFHSTNLTKLTTKASEIGQYSFSNFNTSSVRRIFIFTGNEITIDENCFYYLQNSIIVFNGTGQIIVNNSFNEIQNCNILIPNTDLPIITNGNRYYGFSNFSSQNRNNMLYVTPTAQIQYRNNVNLNIPNNLIGERTNVVAIVDSNTTYLALREEAGI